MKNRRLLLTAVAGTGILVAFASMALPLDPMRLGGSDIAKADYREHEGKGQREGHHWRGDEDDRYAANGCRGQGGDDEDDDNGLAGCGRLSAPMPQNPSPPSNSLFTPGSKPRAQMN